MSFFDQIDKEKMPKHIAIIMDGNGRWAKQRGLDRTYGHQEGLRAVRRLIEAAKKANIAYLTLYTFSTENWNRPEEEIKALMQLMIKAVHDETPELLANNIQIKAIGDLDRLPEETRKALNECIIETSVNTGPAIVLALSYSSRWEITNAVKQITDGVKNGNIKESEINEDLISNYLCTKDIPNPDLLIRTGNEKRISNFLLWQIAYSELYFTDVLWPNFDEECLFKAVVDYQQRERRFGKTSEQVSDIK